MNATRLAVPLALVALAFAIFASWMHLAVLDPTNAGWLLMGGDRGQGSMGLAAYLRAGHWPSLHEPLLAAPEGMTLLFTDSNPLLGFGLGPVARLLPPGLQFVGAWYLLCVLLQVIVVWKLVRPHAPDETAAFLATTLLALMPALLNRYGHPTLCAQWLVLWALWVFVDERWAVNILWWAAVLGMAAFLHSYLLLMVATFWGSAVLRDLIRGPHRLRTIARAAALVALVVAIEAWHGVLAHRYASTGTYGMFPLALDAWWNPANPAYAALIPSTPDTGKGFEGLQYLGAGLLLGAILACAAAWQGRGELALRRLLWLAPAFLVILLIAIGPQPYWRGQPLFILPLTRWWVDLLDPVRAGGRMAWPITYTLAYAILVTLLRQPRAGVILAGLLLIQLVDLRPMLVATRATSARAEDRHLYLRTRDPRWPGLIAGASAVQFEPAEPYRDLQLMEEVTWRAIGACRPVRYFYASREATETRARIDRDSADFRAGRLDPTRLYVMLDSNAPFTLSGRVQRIDGIGVIPPSAPSTPPACSSSPRSAS